MNVNENRKGGLHRLTAVILINTSNEIYQSINSSTFCVPYAAPRFHLSVSFWFSSVFFAISPYLWLLGRLTAALCGSWNLNQGL